MGYNIFGPAGQRLAKGLECLAANNERLIMIIYLNRLGSEKICQDMLLFFWWSDHMISGGYI